MNLSEQLLESLKSIEEKGPDGGAFSKIIFGNRDYAVRVINKKDKPKVEKLLKENKVKFESVDINLSTGNHTQYNGHVAIGFNPKFEDTVDLDVFDDNDINNANPTSYDDDWRNAKL